MGYRRINNMDNNRTIYIIISISIYINNNIYIWINNIYQYIYIYRYRNRYFLHSANNKDINSAYINICNSDICHTFQSGLFH